MGHCCDRPDHVWGMIVEGLWNFGLEKPLSAQSLLSYCGNLEDNAENSADDESLAFKVQREV